ncbi:MAG: manganese efflux pump MntP family protein [Bacteroidales bacterium]|nr:manganese efflux pump MntP family protein [Bacteroidales bacterium]
MNIFEIILLAVALAMDCLTVSIVAGVLGMTGHLRWRMAFFFGLFQALMPLIGWWGISMFSSYLEAVDHWIAFGLLALIGGNMLKESMEPEDQQHFNADRLSTQLLLAIATSIDALAVGITFGCTGYDEVSKLTLPLVVIGLVSFIFSLAGYHLGHRFGAVITRRFKPELVGGLILIAIGVRILITHLFDW